MGNLGNKDNKVIIWIRSCLSDFASILLISRSSYLSALLIILA